MSCYNNFNVALRSKERTNRSLVEAPSQTQNGGLAGRQAGRQARYECWS